MFLGRSVISRIPYPVSRIPPLVETNREFRQTPSFYIIRFFSECFIEFTFDPLQGEIRCGK